MTAAFDRFHAQYNARGREKMDGYSAADFEGLTDDERQRAAAMLYDELAGMPGIAAAGLVLLDRTIAKERLSEYLRHHSATGSINIHEVYFHLWRVTGDITLQQWMMASYDHCPATARAGMFMELGETPATPELDEFMRDRVLHEEDETARAIAARVVLSRSNLPDTPVGAARREALLKRLNDPSEETRASTLSRL